MECQTHILSFSKLQVKEGELSQKSEIGKASWYLKYQCKENIKNRNFLEN